MVKKSIDRFVQSCATTHTRINTAIDNRIDRLCDTLSGLTGALHTAEQRVFQETLRLKNSLFHKKIREGDNVEGSTPLQRRLKTDFDTTAIDAVLKKLRFDSYSGANATRFFKEETKHQTLYKELLRMDSLKDFGVPNHYIGSKKLNSSIAYKGLIRKHLDQTLKKPLPEDPDKRNKIIAFQILAFANADLLIGELKYEAERYQGYVEAAVKKSNILPLVMMKELAGISPRAAFSNQTSFEQLIHIATNQDIANYLREASDSK